MEHINKYMQQGLDWFIGALPNLILAIAVLIVGLWLIRKLTSVLGVTFEKSGFTPEISSFLISLATAGLKVLLIISVAGMVGVNTAAFVGILAAAGLAVGLALQGSLGNFAAGIIIVTFKPYKVGDWIEVKEKFGKVTEVQIFNTQVTTPGNKTLIIPNGEVINGIITNYSKRGNIRIELKVKLSYSEDFSRVKAIIMEELHKIPQVLESPQPEIGIEEYGDTNLIINIRPYVKPDDYWAVYYTIMERVKTLFHEHDIKISFADGMQDRLIGA
jgi:small conductance mechanosensitive channel